MQSESGRHASFGELPVPSKDEIREILIQRVDDYKHSVGIVVGMMGPAGQQIVSYGSFEKGDPRSLDGDAVFEIGSVTKVFTALLLADMVQRGEVALSDPLATCLPAHVTVPQRNGRQITLEDLATHTSGLPRLPSNLKYKDLSNPYAGYTAEHLYEFLSTYVLPREVGSQFEYSNLGFGLLGHALERRASMDYEALVRARILKPLGMNSTSIALSPDMKARLASGHTATLERTGLWDLPTFAGAGALRSSANDMLTFLAANLGYTESPLAIAMATTLKTRRLADREIGIGWQTVTLDGIFTRDGHRVVWHDGGTGGHRAFLGFDPKARTGVVVLANAFSGVVDDIGLHLVDARFPLNKRTNKRR